MKHRSGRGVALAVAFGLGAGSCPAHADDAALLAKLDAVEKRLAHIEAMEQARGPKTPFSFALPSTEAVKALGLCRMLGYAQSMSEAAPGIPGNTQVVCYGP